MKRMSYTEMYYAGKMMKKGDEYVYKSYVIEQLNLYKLIQREVNKVNKKYNVKEYSIVGLYDTTEERLNYYRISLKAQGTYIRKRVELADTKLKIGILENTKTILEKDKDLAKKYQEEANETADLYINAYKDIRFIQNKQDRFGIKAIGVEIASIIGILICWPIGVIATFITVPIILYKIVKMGIGYTGKKINEKKIRYYLQRKARNSYEFTEKFRK